MSTLSTVVEVPEHLDANIKTAARRNVKVEGQGIPWTTPVDDISGEDVGQLLYDVNLEPELMAIRLVCCSADFMDKFLTVVMFSLVRGVG